MLINKFYKNILSQNVLRQFKLNVNPKINRIILNYSSYHTKTTKFLQTVPNILNCRNYCENSESKSNVRLPALSDDKLLAWPNFFKTWKNFIQVNLIIKRHLDKEFDMKEFIDGSKHAVSVVSSGLANEDYDSLGDLVTQEAIEKIKPKISSLSPAQKELIEVKKDDIYITFPYEVGIIFDENENENEKDHKRFVEITVVYHTLKGLSKMIAENKPPPMNMGIKPEYQELMFICNYRFIREYTEGIESFWKINNINHYMPVNM